MLFPTRPRFVEPEANPWRPGDRQEDPLIFCEEPLVSFQRSTSEDSFSGINVTPLTDVMLVLLITFLLSASTFESSALTVPLPQVRQSQDIEKYATILEVGQDGSVAWTEPTLSARPLVEAFAQLLSLKEEKILALGVHRDCEYGALFKLMEAATEAGWPQVILLTVETE